MRKWDAYTNAFPTPSSELLVICSSGISGARKTGKYLMVWSSMNSCTESICLPFTIPMARTSTVKLDTVEKSKFILQIQSRCWKSSSFLPKPKLDPLAALLFAFCLATVTDWKLLLYIQTGWDWHMLPERCVTAQRLEDEHGWKWQGPETTG